MMLTDGEIVHRVLQEAITQVEAAAPEGRPLALQTAAASLGDAIEGKLIRDSDAERTLLVVCARIGLIAQIGEDQALARIRSGIELGRATARSGTWFAAALVGSKQQPLANEANAVRALSSPRFQGLVGRDVFQGKIMKLRPLPGEGPEGYPKPLTRSDRTKIRVLLQEDGLPNLSESRANAAIDLVADDFSYHPVQDYLRRCRDKFLGNDPTCSRLPGLFSQYAGAEVSPYTSEIALRFAIAAVARIFQPGCKFDYIPILEGPEGKGKSRLCKALGDPWFSETLPAELESKDASIHLAGVWILEWSELLQVGRSRKTAIKSFLSRQAERYRPLYEGQVIEQPRSCVFIGTTNLRNYLDDTSGNRRLWGVQVGDCEPERFLEVKDLFWGEAVHRYESGETWFVDPDFEKQHMRPQQQAAVQDVYVAPIQRYLKRVNTSRVTVFDIALGALGLTAARLGPREQERIERVLHHCGYERSRDPQDPFWVRVRK